MGLTAISLQLLKQPATTKKKSLFGEEIELPWTPDEGSSRPPFDGAFTLYETIILRMSKIIIRQIAVDETDF